MTAAIPLDKATIGQLGPLLEALLYHGFDDVLFLKLEYGAERETAGLDVFIKPDMMVRQIHPDFVVEAALSEAPSEWVFILFPGEQFVCDEETGTDAPYPAPRLKEFLRTVSTVDNSRAQLRVNGNSEVRGFCKVGIGSGVAQAPVDLIGAGQQPEPKPITWPESELPLTVILPTWRLGGLDVTLDALAKQTVSPGAFEVIIVDALHRWRAVAVAHQLARYKFNIQHVPVDNAVFPVSSHGRFRNTAIRRARGRRLVFFSDYAVPSPDYLAHHIDGKEDEILVTPWLRTAMHPATVACPHDPSFAGKVSVWDVIETAQRGEFLWSTFHPGTDPLEAALEHEQAKGLTPARYPKPDEHYLGSEEFMCHWKADSVDTAKARLVNGWDEAFDGNGGYCDAEFTLRLTWAGVKPRALDNELRVLDGHEISVAPLRDATRNNRIRLRAVRERKAMRCVYGLVHGVMND